MNDLLENKQLKILFLILYGILMLGSIWQEVDMALFLLLFVLMPAIIYIFVKYIYVENNDGSQKKN
jgi:hypothetical protein